MTALRSIQAARSMLDEIASTQPLTNEQTIDLANAFAHLADAEARLKHAEGAKETAAGISDAVDVLQALQIPASKALTAAETCLKALTAVLKRPGPHGGPHSSPTMPVYPPGVR